METAMRVLSVPSTDGVVLQVQDRGVWYPPSAPSSSHLEGADAEAPVTMLLVHANGFHGRVFDPLVDALRAGAASRGRAVRLVTFDMRAHGASTPPRVGKKKDTLRWDRFADDVLAAARAIPFAQGLPGKKSAKEVHAVGHSLGAHAALRAEARSPGTFASIFAFEPIFVLPKGVPVPPGVFSPDLARAAAKRRESFASKAAALATYASKPPMRAFHRGALEAYVDHGFVVAESEGDDTDAADDTRPMPGRREETKGETARDGENKRVRLAMRRDDEALVFAHGGSETEALRTVCSPGAVSCPVTIARGSTKSTHDPAMIPYPAFVASVVAETMGPETARRLETNDGWDHFAPVAVPGEFAERVWNHIETNCVGELGRRSGYGVAGRGTNEHGVSRDESRSRL
jgi:pimeloyl-ACP methyl ester carboxylesterase